MSKTKTGLLKRSKRGSLQDIAFAIVVMFFFGFVVLISFKIMDEWDTQIQSLDIIPDNAKTASSELRGNFPGIIDNMVLFFFVGLSIIIWILASLVRVHPVFLIFFMIGMVILVIVAAAMSNVYQEAASNAEFTALADELVFTSHILNNLPLWIGLIGLILMAVTYKVFQNS